jgi:hypothetical protein
MKAIDFTVHIQTDIQGKITYVADLGVGRGYVVVGDTFDNLVLNIMKKVDFWRVLILDKNQTFITDKDDIKVIKDKINEWYGN